MGSFVSYWLLNYSAFPLFDHVYLQTREASAIVGGLALTALAFASYWHPRPVHKPQAFHGGDIHDDRRVDHQ